NGGIGAGTEVGDLPTATGNRYTQFNAKLKNLYGQIEISDKAMLASGNSAGAFVNLLNDEMEGLMKASKFNFGRMLFGDGTGTLTITKTTTASNVVNVLNTYNLAEGMVVDILSTGGAPIVNGQGRLIMNVDRTADTITLSGSDVVTTANNNRIVLQGSNNLELLGLGAIFQPSGSLYGVPRNVNSWMQPHSAINTLAIDDQKIQTAIDTVEEKSGGEIDFIVCSYGVRRAYQAYLQETSRNIDVMNLQGGFKAISFAGIPIVADRFCPPGTMYLLDSSEFTLHQLCDWRWLEDGAGHILHQVSGTAKYTATLVKYAELMCDKPAAQACLRDITEK
ncbi:MAG: phage major capsid protein, partial [Clostridia bacterium]|nr:phage major capsid protein [Clostridia bacterium]